MKRLKIASEKAVFYTCTVLAEIKLFAHDHAQAIGRKNPIMFIYRPNHWFGDYQTIDGTTYKMFLMGNIKLLESELLELEQTGLAEITLNWQSVLNGKCLKPHV